MNDKTCIDCVSWYFYSGSPHYSDLTPGDSWESCCKKGHWEADGTDESQTGYRSKLLTATNCTDFVRVP